MREALRQQQQQEEKQQQQQQQAVVQAVEQALAVRLRWRADVVPEGGARAQVLEALRRVRRLQRRRHRRS